MTEIVGEPKSRWKHRRRMAYASMVGLFVAVLFLGLFAVLGPDEVFDRLSKVGMILSTILFGLVSIVGAYVGFATLDDMNKDKTR